MASLDPLPDTALQDAENNNALFTALCKLTHREEYVVRSVFGIGQRKAKTAGDTSRSLGVTHHRTCCILRKALKKLRHPARSRGLRHFLVCLASK
jgi:RNA polymerase primary sigma factor